MMKNGDAPYTQMLTAYLKFDSDEREQLVRSLSGHLWTEQASWLTAEKVARLLAIVLQHNSILLSLPQ